MADIMQTIPEFFKGRSIFITGATGFLGKVLMEKLLRSCPDVATLYILVRPKKGHDPQSRVKIISELPLFDRLKQERPGAVAKIIAMEGDVSKLGLGLSDADRQTLEENVSIVFHMAASIRFDDLLVDAIFMNLRSTREVMELSKCMKQLKLIIHVSTAYCNIDEREVYEKIYEPTADWHQMINLAENIDNVTLRLLTAKVLNTHPNTYTFTKALAEQVVKSYYPDLPVVIVRPSVVVSSKIEPIPGWIDNFNGPMGLMVAGGKGISHVLYCNKSCKVDYIPVDIVCRGIIAGTWYHAHQKREKESEVPVYNASAADVKRITMSEMMSISASLGKEIPCNNILYYPCGIATKSRMLFYLLFAVWHILPAILVDTILYIKGVDFRLLRIQRRIFAANLALSHFTLNEWRFHNKKSIKMQDYIKQEDLDAFSFGMDDTDELKYITNALVGGRLYLLKESLSSLPAARRHYKRMKILHYILCVATGALTVWFLYGVLSHRFSAIVPSW